MSTSTQLFTAAYAKSRKNQPGITATASELLATMNRVFPLFWQIGARINPTFFGKRADVTWNASVGVGGGWARPSDAEAIYLIEDDTPAEVIVVPFEERDADPWVPAVYEWGQVFYGAGNSLDPAESSITDLTFWYSKKPDVITDASAELEALWSDTFDELIVLELAIILSLKDDRQAEVAQLRADRDAWLRRFIAHLEHSTTGVTRATGSSQRFLGQTYAPLAPLLAGGSEVTI